jgi:hypothetical protein
MEPETLTLNISLVLNVLLGVIGGLGLIARGNYKRLTGLAGETIENLRKDVTAHSDTITGLHNSVSDEIQRYTMLHKLDSEVTVPDAAKILGVSATKIYQSIRADGAPHRLVVTDRRTMVLAKATLKQHFG